MVGFGLGRFLPGAVRPLLGDLAAARRTERAARRLARVARTPRPFSGDDIAVLGFFKTRSGLGRAAELLVRGWQAEGKRVVALDLSQPLRWPLTLDEDLSRPIALAGEQPIRNVVVVANPPHTLQALALLDDRTLAESCRVAHWAWEVDRIPPSWSRSLPFLDEVWAPSPFVREAIERTAGPLGERARVVPYPFALDPVPAASPEERGAARAALGLAPAAFTVLSSWSAVSGFERKNPLGAIAAFQRAFHDPAAPRQLVLRCLDAPLYPEGDARVRRAIAGDPRIRYVTAPGEGGLLRYYQAADLYLSLHRGEGFGLNLAEALTADIPVLATAWSLAPVLRDHPLFTAVASTVVPVADPQGLYRRVPGACWAEPDEADAARKLAALAPR